MGNIPADTEMTELSVQLADHSLTVVAEPSSSSAPIGNVISAEPISLSRSDRLLVASPSEIPNAIAQAAKTISSVVRPLPWLGPAAEMVASIIQLCQNVSKNKLAASELAQHCDKMYCAINGTFPEECSDNMEELKSELETLLYRIKAKVEKWSKYNFLKAIVAQEDVAGSIKTFHIEIDQFCKRYTIAFQHITINWMELHEERSKADMTDLMAFLAASENRQILEAESQKAQLNEIREDLRVVLHMLQQILLQSNLRGLQRSAAMENFLAMCTVSGELPPDVELPEDFLEISSYAVGGSGTFDIFRERFLGRDCAIKVVRRVAYNKDTKRRFERQLSHWKAVNERDRGKYILPLVAAVFHTEDPPMLCLVSPWMEKGNALHYVKTTENVDTVMLIRHIAEGLSILHTNEPPLLHGFLKASNILIKDFGDPILADFGLLRIVELEGLNVNSCPDAITAYRWLAPEMISGVGYEGDNAPNLTTKADVFMFAMTVLELMTREKPYAGTRGDPQVLVNRSKGHLPSKPQGDTWKDVQERGLDDRLWALLERCWSKNPEARPTIAEVLEELEIL